MGSRSEESRATARRLAAQLADPDLRFPSRPALVPDLELYPMPDGLGLAIHGAATPVQIQARSTADLVDLLRSLTGDRSVNDLLEATADVDQAADLLQLLVALHGRGLLGDGPSGGSNGPPVDSVEQRQRLFWGRKTGFTGYQPDGGSTQLALESRSLLVVAAGLLGEVTLDLAARSGIRIGSVFAWPGPADASGGSAAASAVALRRWLEDCPPPDMAVVVLRSVPAAVFESVDDWAQRSGVPWISAHDDGMATDIGPLVLPGESACYRCLTTRGRASAATPIEDRFVDAARAGPGTGLRGERLTAATFAAAFLVGDVERHLTGIAAPATVNGVYRVDQLSGQVVHNRLVRVPRCVRCGSGAPRRMVGVG